MKRRKVSHHKENLLPPSGPAILGSYKVSVSWVRSRAKRSESVSRGPGSVINAGYRPWPANNNDCTNTTVNTSNESTGITGTNGQSANISESLKGGNTAIDNRPDYFALCYIMRTS